MKILLTLFVLLFSSLVVANDYILTCISDKNFLTTTYVNEFNKEIIHLSSKNLETGKVYNDVNKKRNVISWINKEVHVLDIDIDGHNKFITYDLNNYNYLITSHYLQNILTDKFVTYTQTFKCTKG